MAKSPKTTLTDSNLKRAGALLKVLSHPARLKILIFTENSEEKVTAIQKHVKLTQAMTSQHLKVLYEAGYLNRRRSGTSIYYSATKDQGKKILPCLRKCPELWVGKQPTVRQ